ncbi:acylphosphatase [Candidatus Woesearchaeota archaeon]|nr:acylphosphatase [Candidatus Woesearchaeota archaeon]
MYSRAKIIIKGLVQKIGFRKFLKDNALKLDIKGYAKNLSKNKVKLFIEGPKDSIDKMIEICKKGSDISLIKEIKVEIENYKEEFTSFEIK